MFSEAVLDGDSNGAISFSLCLILFRIIDFEKFIIALFITFYPILVPIFLARDLIFGMYIGGGILYNIYSGFLILKILDL